MRWLTELWNNSTATAKIALVVAVVVVVLGLVWLGVSAGDIAAWLGST